MALRAGTEDKKKVYLAAGLGLIVLFLLIRMLWQNFGSSGPAAPPPAPAVSAPAATAPAPPATYAGPEAAPPQDQYQQPYAHEAVRIASASPLDPTLHPEIMRQAESLEYTGNGRNIFSLFSMPQAIPKAIASARASREREMPQGPPPPPPIALRYYGYAQDQNGRKQVFLLHGDDVFIASEGDVVDRRYRVGAIGPMSVQVEDIPYHNTQSLPLVQ